MVKVNKIDQALWIAAAVRTFEIYEKKIMKGLNIVDLYFKKSEIIKLANKFYSGSDIKSGEVSKFFYAINMESPYKYFINKEESNIRLVYNGEMNFKGEKPLELNKKLSLDTAIGKKTVGDLINFIDIEYTEFIKKNFKIKLNKEDYLEILDFLSNNALRSYRKPEKVYDNAESKKYEDLKKKAKYIINKLKDIADSFEEFGIYREVGKPLKWLDGSNTKVRDYLWCELKRYDRLNLASSISIVVEKDSKEKYAGFRVSLETKDKECDEKDYLRHFQFLDLIDLDKDEFIYLDSEYNIIHNKNKIQNLIENVRERKVLKLGIGRALKYEDIKDMTLEEIENFFICAVRNLLKYYYKAVEINMNYSSGVKLNQSISKEERFEREIISIPAAKTIEEIYKYRIHSHPDVYKSYPYKKAMFYTFREAQGWMKKLYELDGTVSFSINECDKIDKLNLSCNIKERLKGYIKKRKEGSGFSYNGDYKFYILSEPIEILDNVKLPKRNNHTYFRIEEFFSGKELIESDKNYCNSSKKELNNKLKKYMNFDTIDNIEYENIEIEELNEGEKFTQVVNKRKRNAKLRKLKLESFKREHGKVYCEVCGILEPIVLDVHHDRVKVSEMGEKHITKLSDVRVLCANCHRIVHAKEINVDKLIEEIKANNN